MEKNISDILARLDAVEAKLAELSNKEPAEAPEQAPGLKEKMGVMPGME